jgi:hypothetical protein
MQVQQRLPPVVIGLIALLSFVLSVCSDRPVWAYAQQGHRDHVQQDGPHTIGQATIKKREMGIAAGQIHTSTRRVVQAVDPEPPPEGGGGGILESIIKYIINATVYFPAKTFEKAVIGATRAIFMTQFKEMAQPLESVLNVYGFSASTTWGDKDVDANVGRVLTDVAVPIWMLSLSLIALTVLMKNAAGVGQGTSELASELGRWFFIALASANGITIVNTVHKAFNGLAIAIMTGPGPTSARDFVQSFMLPAGVAETMPIFVLVAGAIIGFVMVLVMCVTYIARITMLYAVAGLAPLAIAAEGIPFTRFVFRDWLSMFLRLELLNVLNAIILTLYNAIGWRVQAMSNGGGIVAVLLMFALQIGLACVIISLNMSVFNQVFGLAVDVANKVIGTVTTAAGLIAAAATGGAAAPAIAGAGASVGNSLGAGSAGASTSGGLTALTNTSSALGALGRAANLPLLTPATSGLANGVGTGYQMRARQEASNRMAQQQRDADQARARALAKDVGASSARDIDTIANSITNPPKGLTSQQMAQAYRQVGPSLQQAAGLSRSPAMAASQATGGQSKSFGDFAVAVASERARMAAGQLIDGKATPVNSPQPVAASGVGHSANASSVSPSNPSSPQSVASGKADTDVATQPQAAKNGMNGTAQPSPKPATPAAVSRSSGPGGAVQLPSAKTSVSNASVDAAVAAKEGANQKGAGAGTQTSVQNTPAATGLADQNGNPSKPATSPTQKDGQPVVSTALANTAVAAKENASEIGSGAGTPTSAQNTAATTVLADQNGHLSNPAELVSPTQRGDQTSAANGMPTTKTTEQGEAGNTVGHSIASSPVQQEPNQHQQNDSPSAANAAASVQQPKSASVAGGGFTEAANVSQSATTSSTSLDGHAGIDTTPTQNGENAAALSASPNQDSFQTIPANNAASTPIEAVSGRTQQPANLDTSAGQPAKAEPGEPSGASAPIGQSSDSAKSQPSSEPALSSATPTASSGSSTNSTESLGKQDLGHVRTSPDERPPADAQAGNSQNTLSTDMGVAAPAVDMQTGAPTESGMQPVQRDLVGETVSPTSHSNGQGDTPPMHPASSTGPTHGIATTVGQSDADTSSPESVVASAAAATSATPTATPAMPQQNGPQMTLENSSGDSRVEPASRASGEMVHASATEPTNSSQTPMMNTAGPAYAPSTPGAGETASAVAPSSQMPPGQSSQVNEPKSSLPQSAPESVQLGGQGRVGNDISAVNHTGLTELSSAASPTAISDPTTAPQHAATAAHEACQPGAESIPNTTHQLGSSATSPVALPTASSDSTTASQHPAAAAPNSEGPRIVEASNNFSQAASNDLSAPTAVSGHAGQASPSVAVNTEGSLRDTAASSPSMSNPEESRAALPASSMVTPSDPVGQKSPHAKAAPHAEDHHGAAGGVNGSSQGEFGATSQAAPPEMVQSNTRSDPRNDLAVSSQTALPQDNGRDSAMSPTTSQPTAPQTQLDANDQHSNDTSLASASVQHQAADAPVIDPAPTRSLASSASGTTPISAPSHVDAPSEPVPEALPTTQRSSEPQIATALSDDPHPPPSSTAPMPRSEEAGVAQAATSSHLPTSPDVALSAPAPISEPMASSGTATQMSSSNAQKVEAPSTQTSAPSEPEQSIPPSMTSAGLPPAPANPAPIERPVNELSHARSVPQAPERAHVPASSPPAPSFAEFVAKAGRSPVEALSEYPPSAWPGNPLTQRAADGVTLHDWGVGNLVAWHTQSAENGPGWTLVMSDLRRASASAGFGESYVGKLMQEVRTNKMTEGQLQTRIDHDLEKLGERASELGLKIRRFWRPEIDLGSRSSR